MESHKYINDLIGFFCPIKLVLTNQNIMKQIRDNILIIILVAFALLTLFLSSSVIFDWFGIRAKEGNYVLFVVWANFLSSILYLFAAFGFFANKKWTMAPLSISAVLLIIAQIGLFWHINAGGIYETKTVKAMFFRIGLTGLFILFAYLKLKKTPQKN